MIKILKKNNPSDETMEREVKDLAISIESSVYTKAMNKQYFIHLLNNRLKEEINRLISGDLTAASTGNQKLSKTIWRPVVTKI